MAMQPTLHMSEARPELKRGGEGAKGDGGGKKGENNNVEGRELETD